MKTNLVECLCIIFHSVRASLDKDLGKNFLILGKILWNITAFDEVMTV